MGRRLSEQLLFCTTQTILTRQYIRFTAEGKVKRMCRKISGCGGGDTLLWSRMMGFFVRGSASRQMIFAVASGRVLR